MNLTRKELLDKLLETDLTTIQLNLIEDFLSELLIEERMRSWESRIRNEVNREIEYMDREYIFNTLRSKLPNE